MLFSLCNSEDNHVILYRKKNIPPHKLQVIGYCFYDDANVFCR